MLKIIDHTQSAARRRGLIRAVAGATLAISLFASATPSYAAEQWQAYTYWGSPKPVAAAGFIDLAKKIEEASNGALTIKFNIGGSLSIAAANISSAVSDDVIQIADDYYNQGVVEASAILALPLLASNAEEMSKVVEVIRPSIERDYGNRGVIPLGYYVYPQQVVWSRGDIASLADLKGKKIRVSSVENGQFIELFGGFPVTLGSAEVPGALERGLVDGVVTASAGGVVTYKDLIKSSYRIAINYPVSWIVVNKERFEALPEELQATIRKIVVDATEAQTVAIEADDQSMTKLFGDDGIKITPVTDADLALARERSVEIWDSWGKDRSQEVRDLLAKAREALGR